MEPDTTLADLLRCAIHVVGRIAIPPDQVRQILAGGDKSIKAFNLCDGTRTLTEIAKGAGLDQGNLSRAASRWVAHGVAFWVGKGRDARLMNIYPIPKVERPKSPNR